MKTKVRSLMQEAAIGALAQMLLPGLVGRTITSRTLNVFSRSEVERELLLIDEQHVRQAFAVAEAFLDERARRLRLSEEQLQRRRALRQKPRRRR